MSDGNDKVVYNLDVDQPGLPKGELVQIPGLGTFENGSSYEVTKSEADAYRSYNSTQEPTHNDEEEITGSEMTLGPTLLEASKTMYGIEVTTASSTGGGNTPPKPQANNDDDNGGDN